MVKKRKPKIDLVERTILRLMLSRKMPFTGNEIAKRIGMTASAVNKRMLILRRKGLVIAKKGKERSFMGAFRVKNKKNGKVEKVRRRIKAPSRIFWFLNIRKKK